jgi:transcriptional regulator NrdR family protein
VNCPKCGGESKITDTEKAGVNKVEQRRRCLACGLVFQNFVEKTLGEIGVKPFIRTSARYRSGLEARSR